MSIYFIRAWVVLGILVGAVDAMALDNEAHTEREPIFTPILSSDTHLFKEEATLSTSKHTVVERRPMWQTNLGGGLAYQLPSGFLGMGHVTGQSLISAGLLFETGDWPLILQQAFFYNVRVKKWLGFSIGLSGSAVLNIKRFSRSHMHFGLPLAIRLGPVSIGYSPGLNVSISNEKKEVYDGTLTKRTANGWIPVSFFVSLHLEPLGW